jgi:hypothetical protein
MLLQNETPGEVAQMNPTIIPFRKFLSVFMPVVLSATPLLAQRPATAPAKPPRETLVRVADPTFDTLLAADTYKLYGEVRNIGQLLSTGGAAEIVDPIIKLANPGQQFQSMVNFLRKNDEALANSRLLFASWPTRANVPNEFVAIEFATPEEAAKFSPKLETFLPTVLPPIEPEAKPGTSPATKPGEPSRQPQSGSGKQTTNESGKGPVTAPNRNSSAEHLPFVLSQRGNLVFISDQSFKFELLHPASSKGLAEDQNFRIAHDRFSSESVFLYFDLGADDHSKSTPSPTPIVTVQTAEPARARSQNDPSMQQPSAAPGAPDETRNNARVITAEATPESAPQQTKQQQAQMNASSQIGGILDLLGAGEPQWPEAVGVALVLDNNEYVVRAILIEPPERRKLPLPFLPQLISGAPLTPGAPQVLPDDTEAFVSASIDLSQTHDALRKQAETKAKASARQMQAAGKEAPLDAFAEFEKKAGFNIKDDLLPVLGNEIAIASSLKTIQGFGFFGTPPPAKPSPSPNDAKTDQTKNGSDVFPMFLIAIKDRDAARRLMPHVLDGMGFGEANLIAQVEKHDDAEMVTYAGMFAYAFVGDFLVISEAATVRHVVDAYTNRQTLAANTAFRNFTRWQPRQSLGEIYVSPALMDSYREQLNKQAPKMDSALRDLLMSLSPAPQAISYSLSNEGFGAVHELHLPKDLVIAMVAGTSASMNAIASGGAETNELVAVSGLTIIASSEETYKASAGNGSYATLDKLIEQKLVGKQMFENYGYKYEVAIIGDDFQVTAIPAEYGKTGKRSFFVDKTRVVRGDDHGGAPATASDKPFEP